MQMRNSNQNEKKKCFNEIFKNQSSTIKKRQFFLLSLKNGKSSVEARDSVEYFRMESLVGSSVCGNGGATGWTVMTLFVGIVVAYWLLSIKLSCMGYEPIVMGRSTTGFIWKPVTTPPVCQISKKMWFFFWIYSHNSLDEWDFDPLTRIKYRTWIVLLSMSDGGIDGTSIFMQNVFNSLTLQLCSRLCCDITCVSNLRCLEEQLK